MDVESWGRRAQSGRAGASKASTSTGKSTNPGPKRTIQGEASAKAGKGGEESSERQDNQESRGSKDSDAGLSLRCQKVIGAHAGAEGQDPVKYPLGREAFT